MSSVTNLREDVKNPWFLAIVGLIGTALAATIWMAMIAGSSSPGLVSEDYYEKGKAYFHEAPAEAEAAFRLSLMPPATAVRGTAQPYKLYIIDAAGQPVDGATATVQAYRPSDATADFSRAMQQHDHGSYRTSLNFPLPGTWDLIVRINYQGQHQQMTQRIFIAD